MSVDIKVATERAEARIGSVINDKWRLDRLLGVGGMACVYAATHRNKKRAAVKMLHREYSTDADIRERFLREGYLANSVGHRGVVTVDDDDIAEDGGVFIVMELLDGETLEQRWRRKEHRLPIEEVLAVADQVLDALVATTQLFTMHEEEDAEGEAASPACMILCRWLAQKVHGIYQVDGQGVFDEGGRLLLAENSGQADA